MKKLLVSAVVFLYVMSSVLSAIEVSDNDFIDATSIKNGIGQNEILYDDRKNSPFSYGIGFVFYQPDVGWVVGASQNQKILVFDDTFKQKAEYQFTREDLPKVIYFDPKGWSIHSSHNEAVQIRSLATGKTDYVSLSDLGNIPFQAFYFRDYDFFLAKTGKKFQSVFSVLEKYSKKNNSSVVNNISQGRAGDSLREYGFSLSSDSVTYRGFAISTSFRTFLQVTQWEDNKLGTGIDTGVVSEISGYLSGKYDDSPVLFQGFDFDGNFYWMEQRSIYVFNSTGTLVAHIVAPSSVRADGSFKYSYRLAVHPSGDIYRFLMTGFLEPIKVQVLPNSWAPKARDAWAQTATSPKFITKLSIGAFAYPFGKWQEAIINDSNVRVRKKPNLNGAVISQLSKGTSVTVLETGSEKTKENGVEAPWYFVQTWEGSSGWVFGAFLDLKKNE